MKPIGQKTSSTHKQWRKIILSDIRIFANSTDGQAAANLKAILLGAGVALMGAFTLAMLSKSPSAASVPEIKISTPPVVANDFLYDLRSEDIRNAKLATPLQIQLKSGQSLGPLLQQNGVEPNIAYAATQAFSTVYSPKNLRVGQKVSLYFDPLDKNFTGLSMKPGIESTVFVERNSNGEFSAKKVAAEFETKLVLVNSQIENSLYLDAGRLGAPDKVIVQFAQIYAHSVDFQRDIRAGDAFEMIFEAIIDHKGNTLKAGDLVYTSFSPRKKTAAYYLYEKENGREGYYDNAGKGAKRMLMRTPVNGARLSSRYGPRKHPVLGYRKKHKGVDFAAPRGTPIMAAGTGTIERSSRFGSYGNYVRIRHTDGYSTAYAHLSKFARGIKKGRRVIQGQTIGYVGATGRVTGAHLHYEVLKRGRQINPMTLSTLSGKPLKKSELPAFKTRVAEIDALRASLQISTPPEPKLSAERMTNTDN